jgi:hypothetical protein
MEEIQRRIPIPIRTRIIAIGMLRHAVTVTFQDSLLLAACAGTSQTAPNRPHFPLMKGCSFPK